jgi:hypothetical protein
MNQRKITTSLIIAVMISLLAFGAHAAENLLAANYQSVLDVPDDAEINQQLAEVRRTTAKYHDINVAIADGFSLFAPGDCVEDAEGVRGITYVNIPRFISPEVNPDEPEILNYVPVGDGSIRLITVVYTNRSLFRDTRPPETPGYRPGLFPWQQFVIPPYLEEVSGSFSLFGQQAERVFSGRWLYLLPVWVWSPNPSGMFAPLNPSLSCTANN